MWLSMSTQIASAMKYLASHNLICSQRPGMQHETVWWVQTTWWKFQILAWVGVCMTLTTIAFKEPSCCVGWHLNSRRSLMCGHLVLPCGNFSPLQKSNHVICLRRLHLVQVGIYTQASFFICHIWHIGLSLSKLYHTVITFSVWITGSWSTPVLRLSAVAMSNWNVSSH